MAAILGLVASFLGPAIELGKFVAEPIKRQFSYLCCLDSNIQNLRDEAKTLEDARAGLQMQVTRAQNNAEDIVPQVKAWLEEANENIQVNMTGIESEITNIQSGCLAVKSRFSLSKKVKRTTEAMKQLRENCKFDPISHPPPPAAMASIPLGSTYEFESRKHIEEDIMITLRDEKVNMLGICGMGGVGKTTMAKRVMNRVREEHLFDETVMVVVSQEVDMSRIQDDIARALGLKLEEGSLSSKAHDLRTRLVSGKRILIVLDDVWKNIKLEDLGIPCESGLKGCTVLLTSRDRGVLNEMGAQKVCEIRTLSEIEAWSLFKEKVGVCVDDQNLLSLAQEVVEECKGLPIAILNVAVALKDKRYKFIWEDALQQLKSSNPEDMPKVLEDVYKPIKLSYDSLENQHAKSIFLLCCLFPEDHNIPLEYLTVFAMGLHMFERLRNLEQVRNRAYSLVEMLKSRFLLLECENEHYVKMHDVVRDVAVFIASEERRIKCNDCTWISPSLGERIERFIGLEFSNLHLLMTDERVDEFHINDNSFDGLIKLNVLSMIYYSSRSLPPSTQLLKNLRTLLLHSCESLETISIAGELVNLEILICRDCHSIEELPVEIRRLNRLRLLELSKCQKLKTIAPGIISSLVGLEELKMVESFDKWEAEDNEGKGRKNAGLSELESLSNLTSLEIEVEDSTLAAKQIRLSPKLVKFNITIGDRKCIASTPVMGLEKKVNLHLPREITLGKWMLKFFGSVELMNLAGEGSSNLELGQALQNVRSLALRYCSTVKKLVKITTAAAAVFPHLENLQLEELANLEEICDIDGPIPDVGFRSSWFKNLKEFKLLDLPALKQLVKSPFQNYAISLFSNLSSIHLRRCDSLRNLFSLAMANVCFSQLETLEIESCKMMEQVFLWNEEENGNKDIGPESHRGCHIILIFPKLKKLNLVDLPNLLTFCQGIESIEFPLLTHMRIEKCPQLRRLVSIACGVNSHNNLGGIISSDHDEDDNSLHLFCKPQKVVLGSLKELEVEGYNNTLRLWCDQSRIDFFTGLEVLLISQCGAIRSLFSSSIAQNLINLMKLSIYDCPGMVKVIADEEEEYTHMCLFPNLKKIYLDSLPELKSFCEWRSCALELPSLEEVFIGKCPKMARFSLGSALTTPNLKEIRRAVEWGTSITVYVQQVINNWKDLNDGVHQIFLRVKKEEEERNEEEEDLMIRRMVEEMLRGPDVDEEA